MNPDFPQNERAKLEAKLTALLLGELHADEIATLSEAMEQDPELAALYERLKVTVELVREGAAQPKAEEQTRLKLSAARREKLLASFKTVAPKEFAKPRRVMDWLVPLAACVAIVGVLAAMLLPALSGAKRKAMSGSAQTDQLSSMEFQKKLSEDIGSIAPAVVTTARTPQSEFGLAPVATPSATVAPAPIVLPPKQEDAGVQPGQTVVLAGKTHVLHLENADAMEVDRALKQLAGQRTNELALNQPQVWSAGTPKDARDQMLLFGDENISPGAVVAGGVIVTNGIVDSFDTSRSYRMLSQAHETEAGQNKWNWTIDTHDKVGGLTLADGSVAQVDAEGLKKAIAQNAVVHPNVEFYDGAVSNSLPAAQTGQTNYYFFAGDVSAVGRLFKSDSSVAQNGDFTTASTRDDVNGLRYLATNGAVASRSLDEWSFDGITNPASVGHLGVAGTNTFGNGTTVNGGTLTLGAAVTGSSEVSVRQAYIAPPSASDGLLTSGLRAHGAEIVQAENRKSEIVLPSAQNSVLTARTTTSIALSDAGSFGGNGGFGGGGGGGGGGFGGGGSQNSVLMQREQQAIGGKQVELAAAANAPTEFGSGAGFGGGQSRLETATVKVDPNTLYRSLQNGGGINFGAATNNAPSETASTPSFAGVGSTESGGGRGLRYVTGIEPPQTEKQLAVKNFLQAAGVNLDATNGKSVFYNERQGTLTVRGTDEDLNKIQTALDTLNAPKSDVAINAKFAENSNDSQAPGFDWYLGQKAKLGNDLYATNGGVVASGGTTPTPEAIERARVLRESKLQSSSQLVQDGKLLFQLGKTDEAELKLNEALARDPADKGALYYLSLVKQQRVRQIVDERNVTSMDRMVQVEKGWADNDARAKLPAPSMSRTNSVIGSSRQKTSEKLDSIIFDKISLVHLPLSEVLRTLAEQTMRRDIDQQGVNFLLNRSKPATQVSNSQTEQTFDPTTGQPIVNLPNSASDVDLGEVTVSLDPSLKNLRLKDLLEAIVKSADRPITYRILDYGVEFSFPDSSNSQPVTPTSKVDVTPPKPTIPPPTPQPEILTRENAFSTFSLNVSDVSFKLAAASLEKGQLPEPASIRSEEFINAFDYRDPEAAPGVPIAFAAERARYPFAHNRELLRFSLKTAAAGRQAGRPLNIVLLLDNSGSMERADRVTIIREALRVLAKQLQASDTFSIVTFARTAQLRVDGIPGSQAAAAAEEIAKLTPEGGTNLGEALDLAYETALHHYRANGDNRVVLLTDGAANLGDVNPEVLKQKVEAHRQQGVALDCFGIGWEGYNDDLLETLTRNGDGRYGFINTPEAADTDFVAQIAGALHVAAADVKVQVEFNTNRVTSYRQIGYAKHQLTKEQFRDNTVDAAEIAAQEAGNALYTIEINPSGEGSIATVRVRYKVPGTAEYREQAWDVPYTGGAVAMDQASPAMRLASTACGFSEWLATSPFASEVSTEELLKYLNGVPQVYGADARPAKLEWMIRQAKSISGK